MESDLTRVIYVSSGSGLLTEDQLVHILEQSRANNTRDGLTGMLVYSEGSFLQALEGTDPVLTRTLDRIKADDRHHGFILLSQEPVKERAFPDWSMGFARPGQEELLALKASNDFFADGAKLQGLPPSSAKRLLEGFRRTNP